MDQELDEALCRDFPLLYKDRHASMRTTCMCWGFDIGNGWEPLVRELSSKLEVLIQKFIDDNPNLPCEWCSCPKDTHDEGWTSDGEFEDDGQSKHYKCHNPDGGKYSPRYPCASQVKEKYGTLSFYMTEGTDQIFDLIHEAEEKSAKICEVCGESGKRRGGGWISTLCDKHAK